MPYRQIKGVLHVTMALPFEVTDYQDETLGDDYTAEQWMEQVNRGDLPDWMEGQDIPNPDPFKHECVDWTVKSAEYVVPEHCLGTHHHAAHVWGRSPRACQGFDASDELPDHEPTEQEPDA